jgi:hypothetical protein
MAASINIAAYINSCKRNSGNTLFWGTGTFKDSQDTPVDFNYKIFLNSGTLYIDEFCEGDLVHLTGKFTWEDNSSYHSAGIMVFIFFTNYEIKIKIKLKGCYLFFYSLLLTKL